MKNVESNVIVVKSKQFAIRCVKLCRYLKETKHEFDLSSQLIRSGTSIGANVKEGIRAQSRSDFRAKLNISLKEASESEYWIELLRDTNYINDVETNSIQTAKN